MVTSIWRSYRRLPLWVQIWISALLVPLNLLPLVFWLSGAPFWGAIAFLSVAGMLPNLPIMIRDRGMSKAMSLPHILFWTPLVLILLQVLVQRGLSAPWDGEDLTLAALLVINMISLGFDYVDALKWWRGDRAIA